jgi:hypothetical protein
MKIFRPPKALLLGVFISTDIEKSSQFKEQGITENSQHL